MLANVIFICTSNVCRSPIAEGLAKKLLSERYGIGVQDLEQSGYKVQSRGCSTDFEPVGSPASAHGVAVMRKEYGVDMTAHHSVMLSKADLVDATHVYFMTQCHYNTVTSLCPDLRGLQPTTLSRTPPGANSIPVRSEDGCGEENNTPSPRGKSVVVAVLNPEIPDPWHGTMDCYRSCASMIKEAVEKALKEDIY